MTSPSMLNEQLSVEENEAWLNILGAVDYPADGDPYDYHKDEGKDPEYYDEMLND